MDIEKELDCIQKRFQIERWTLESWGRERQKRIDRLLRPLFQEKLAGKRVAVRGAGRGTRYLLTYYPEFFESAGIFDQTGVGSFQVEDRTYPQYDKKDLKKWRQKCGEGAAPPGVSGGGLLLNGIWSAHDAIKSEADELGMEFVDPFAFLRERGIVGFPSWQQTGVYQPIIEICRYYRALAPQETLEKKCALREMISYFFTIRDLLSVQSCLNEYCRLFPGDADGNNLINEIAGFLDKLKESLRAKNKGRRDILLNWIDMLGYEGLKDMPFLNGLKEQSVFFTKAYTHEGNTRRAMQAIFYGQLPIDDWKRDCGPSPLYTLLSENGYCCACPYVYKDDMLPEDFRHALTAERQDKDSIAFWYGGQPASYILWQTYATILQADKPVFILNHFFPETHIPFLSPGVLEGCSIAPDGLSALPENDYRLFLQKVQTSRAYIDRQLAFARELLGEGYDQIYMSDHGADYNNAIPELYHSDYTHIFVMINSKRLRPAMEQRLFPLRSFTPLIEWLLNGKSEVYEGLFCEYVEQQFLDFYDAVHVARTIEKHREKHGISYRGLRRKQDLFMVNRLGEEFYYRIPDERTNRIEDPAFQEEISYLRERTGTHFLDLEGDEKFQFSKKLYKSLRIREVEKGG